MYGFQMLCAATGEWSSLPEDDPVTDAVIETITCGDNELVCGLMTKIDFTDGLGMDPTGMNNLKLKCCVVGE